MNRLLERYIKAVYALDTPITPYWGPKIDQLYRYDQQARIWVYCGKPDTATFPMVWLMRADKQRRHGENTASCRIVLTILSYTDKDKKGHNNVIDWAEAYIDKILNNMLSNDNLPAFTAETPIEYNDELAAEVFSGSGSIATLTIKIPIN